MRLVSVYDDYEAACVSLYNLLRDRQPHESISHKAMPSFEDHCAFVASRPYEAWYLLIRDVGEPDLGCARVPGAVYLSKQREIGIAIKKGYRHRGYGEKAVQQLMSMHPGRFLWNVNPSNAASIALAHKLGFSDQPIQHTYERSA